MTNKYEMVRIGDYHSLVIRQVAPMDADEYIAKATNSGGSRTNASMSLSNFNVNKQLFFMVLD